MSRMEREERVAWLATLKVNEQVAREMGCGRYRSYALNTVVRITATQIVLNNDIRVNRDDGSIRGRSYQYIEQLTQDLRDKIETSELSSWLTRIPACSMNGWADPPLPVMRAMKAAYDTEMAKLKETPQ